MSQDNVAVVKGIYEAFGRADMHTVFELVHPRCEILAPSRLPWGGQYRGHEGLEDFVGKLAGAVEGKAEIERYIDDGEGHVVAIGRARGRVPATGREYDVPEAAVWTVREGKVVRFEAYVDVLPVREALGIQRE